MENFQFTGVNLRSELREQLEVKCQELGLNITQGVAQAVAEWVSRADAATTIGALLELINAQDFRIATLERQNPQTRNAATPAKPTLPTGYPVKTDGSGRWLNSRGAYEIAIARGIDRPHQAAMAWMGRHPERCEAELGLRWLGNRSRSPIAAKWEDLRWRPRERGELEPEDLNLECLTAEADFLVELLE